MSFSKKTSQVVYVKVFFYITFLGQFNDNKVIFQEKKSIRPTFSAERIYGGPLLAMFSNDFICFYDWAECRLIRRIDVNVKVSNGYPLTLPLKFLYGYANCYRVRSQSEFFCSNVNLFQNLYWAASGDLVAISSDASFYILKYNVRTIICSFC